MKASIFKYMVSVTFLLVFAAKMGLSIAPLIFSIDKETVNAVIMQLELENHHEKETPDAKDLTKWLKKGNELFSTSQINFDSHMFDVRLRYFEKARHYVNTYYPSVLTPPPNSLLV